MTREELINKIQNMTWSFSRINSFNTCKHSWYLTYINGFQGLGSAFSTSGTFSHSILERYAKGKLKKEDLANEFINNYEKEVPFKFPPNKFVDLGEKNYNNGVKYFTEFEGFDDIGNIINAEIKVDTELEDKLNNCKYKFTGYIDLLLENNGEYIVLDHKSKGKFKSKKEQAEYARQLYVYSKYVKEKYGKFPVKLVFNMFNAQTYVEIPFKEKDYNEALQWCVNIISQIKEELRFEKNIDEFFCDNLCNHRLFCNRNN